jgi:hypothetical protein
MLLFFQRSEEDPQQLRNPIDILSDSFLWGHLCPTAPGLSSLLICSLTLPTRLADTIPAFPFTEEDPFIISPPEPQQQQNTQPATLLFCGNQEAYASKLLSVAHLPCDPPTSLLTLCLPKFSITRLPSPSHHSSSLGTHFTHREAVLVDLDSLECRVMSFGI